MIGGVSKSARATVVHVYGTDRSGSTMLDLILGRSPQAFSCGEVSAWFRPYRRHHRRIKCLCGRNPCPVWQKIQDAPEHQFHAATAAKLDVRFVIDSSKDICWLVDAQRWAAAAGLGTVNLMIWKDPLDLAYSYWKRGRTIDEARRSFVSCYGRVIGLELQFQSVHFNDLARDPAAAASRICAALGIPFRDGQERFWEGVPHHLFGSDGIRLQIEKGASRIDAQKRYAPEFERLRDRIGVLFEEDKRVQEIIRELRSADIFSADRPALSRSPFRPSRPLPAWYYRKKWIRALRRYIPEKYKETPGHETVPV